MMTVHEMSDALGLAYNRLALRCLFFCLFFCGGDEVRRLPKSVQFFILFRHTFLVGFQANITLRSLRSTSGIIIRITNFHSILHLRALAGGRLALLVIPKFFVPRSEVNEYHMTLFSSMNDPPPTILFKTL
jgi:hypothetical protein